MHRLVTQRLEKSDEISPAFHLDDKGEIQRHPFQPIGAEPQSADNGITKPALIQETGDRR